MTHPPSPREAMCVPDPDAAVREMGRVLRPEGRAVAAVWGERRRCRWAEIFPIVDARVDSDVCLLFFQLGTGDHLSVAMTKAGFRKVEGRRIETTLEYAGPDEALEGAFAGGPIAMAYSRFDDLTRDQVHQEFLDSLAPFREGEGYRIPGQFVVTRGEWPGG